MQALSRTLVCLYEAAEHVSIKHFPSEALRILRSLITFDGGVLGTGTATDADLTIDQAYVCQRDPAILSEYALISAHDPITRRFAEGIDTPLVCDCKDFYKQGKLSELETFCKRHDLSQLMLFGDSPVASPTAKWIVLYRAQAKFFNALEKQYLMAAWPHLLRALSINTRHFLEAHLGLEARCAVALVNQGGIIEAEHPSFRQALVTEWPGFSGKRLPEKILQSWRLGRSYCGDHIRITMRMQENYILCQAWKAALIERLTQAEGVVASQFASGLSYKEIAENLGLSQHTVRSHIAHVYAKLDVHDKAALAGRLITAAPKC